MTENSVNRYRAINSEVRRSRRRQVGALLLSMAVSGSAMAGQAPQPTWVADAFAGGASGAVETLLEREMAATEGKLAPLGIIAAVAGLDLALAGFFWGVYIPRYAGGGGGCTTCYIPPNRR